MNPCDLALHLLLLLQLQELMQSASPLRSSSSSSIYRRFEIVPRFSLTSLNERPQSRVLSPPLSLKKKKLAFTLCELAALNTSSLRFTSCKTILFRLTREKSQSLAVQFSAHRQTRSQLLAGTRRYSHAFSVQFSVQLLEQRFPVSKGIPGL